MKQITLTTIIILLFNINLKSQCPDNGTHTDWANPTPYVNTFKKNTFDWTQPTIQAGISNNLTPSSYVYNNPYYSTTLFYQISKTNPDIKPEDG